MKRFYKKVFISLILLGLFGIVSNGLALELVWPASPGGIELNDAAGLEELVKYFYQWGILLGGLATFISLTRAGFQYLTSTGDSIKMTEARKDISSAMFGLVILLSSFLILNTVNPELTNLKMPTIEPFGQECLDCMEEWGEDRWGKDRWKDECIDECDLIQVKEPDFSKGCDEIKFYNINYPFQYDQEVLEVLYVDMSDELNYVGKCLQPSPYIYQDSGAIILYLDDKPTGNCIVELYDKTVCDGNPMTTINYSIEDISQLYLPDSIRRVQIKK